MNSPATKVTSANASAEERANYMEVVFTARRELGELIMQLEARKNGFANGAESQFIDSRIDDLRAQRNFLSADLNAFLAGSLSVTPPSDDDVKTIKDLVHKVDAMTAQSTEAAIMVKAADDLLGVWRKTR